MSDEIGKEIIKEIAKEAYQDGGKSIVKPAGETAGLLVRAVKAALSPLEKWVLHKEYSVAETQKLLEQKLAGISADKIDSPEPYIAIPAMQYISYCMDKEELRDMYANLLASSMIETVKDGVHPGFVEIIKQLSPDEAKILKYMSVHDTIPVINLRYENEKGEGIDLIKLFSDVGEKVNCEQKYETERYFDNLLRLGLVEKNQAFSSLTEKTLYDPLKEHPYIKQFNTEAYKNAGFGSEKTTEGFIRLTSFGKAFCDICVNTPNMIVIAE